MLSWSSCYSFPSLLLKLSIGEAVVQQLVGKWLYKQGNSSFWESTIIIPFPSPFPLSQKRWYQSGFHDFLRKKRQTHCVRSLKGVYSKLITNSLKQSRKLYSVFQETRRRGMTSYFSLCIGVFVTNVDWHPICVIGFSSVTITSFRSRTVFILSVLYLAVQFSTYAETPVNVTVSMSVLSVATNIVRILRNICSGSKQNKQVVMSKGIIRCVGVLVRFHVRSLASAKTSTSGVQEKWLGPNGMNSSFRLPCNSCSMWRQGVLLRFGMRCGLSSSQTVLRYASHGIPSSFLMKHYSHNAKLTSYAIAVLYNLVNYQESPPREFANLEYVVKSRDVMHLVFSRGLPDNEGFCSWKILL